MELLTKKSFKYAKKLRLSFNEKRIYAKINIITCGILHIRKLKEENKLKNSYFVDYYKRQSQLKSKIKGLCAFNPLEKKSFNKKLLFEINKMIVEYGL